MGAAAIGAMPSTGCISTAGQETMSGPIGSPTTGQERAVWAFELRVPRPPAMFWMPTAFTTTRRTRFRHPLGWRSQQRRPGARHHLRDVWPHKRDRRQLPPLFDTNLFRQRRPGPRLPGPDCGRWKREFLLDTVGQRSVRYGHCYRQFLQYLDILGALSCRQLFVSTVDTQ